MMRDLAKTIGQDSPSDIDCWALMKKFDSNEDGKLQYSEFVDMCRYYAGSTQATQSPAEVRNTINQAYQQQYQKSSRGGPQPINNYGGQYGGPNHGQFPQGAQNQYQYQDQNYGNNGGFAQNNYQAQFNDQGYGYQQGGQNYGGQTGGQGNWQGGYGNANAGYGGPSHDVWGNSGNGPRQVQSQWGGIENGPSPVQSQWGNGGGGGNQYGGGRY
jgi:hypothetical protein